MGEPAEDNGFQVIGDTALTGGTITTSNFTNANEIALFGPEAINVAAVTVNKAPSTFTVALDGDTGGAAQPGAGPAAFLLGFHNWIINGPAGPAPATANVFNLDMGTATHTQAFGGARRYFKWVN